jgi:hypothetical protein
MSERHFKVQAALTARGDSFDQIHSGLDHKSVKTSFTVMKQGTWLLVLFTGGKPDYTI